MRGLVLWTRPLVFGAAAACFALTFAAISLEISIPGLANMPNVPEQFRDGKIEMSAELSGIDMIRGKSGEAMIDDMLADLPKEAQQQAEQFKAMNPMGQSLDKAGPYSWAMVGAGCIVLALILGFIPGLGSAIPSILLSGCAALAMVLLKSQVTEDADLPGDVDMGIIKISLAMVWQPWQLAAAGLSGLGLLLNIGAAVVKEEEAPTATRPSFVPGMPMNSVSRGPRTGGPLSTSPQLAAQQGAQPGAPRASGPPTLGGPRIARDPVPPANPAPATGPPPLEGPPLLDDPVPAAAPARAAGPPPLEGPPLLDDPAPAPRPAPPPAAQAQPGVINMACPNPDCGRTLAIPEQYRGQAGGCKHCGTQFTVPS